MRRVGSGKGAKTRRGLGSGVASPRVHGTGRRARAQVAMWSRALSGGSADAEGVGGIAKGKRTEEEGRQVECTVLDTLGHTRGHDKPVSHRGTWSHVLRQRPPRQPLTRRDEDSLEPRGAQDKGENDRDSRVRSRDAQPLSWGGI